MSDLSPAEVIFSMRDRATSAVARLWQRTQDYGKRRDLEFAYLILAGSLRDVDKDDADAVRAAWINALDLAERECPMLHTMIQRMKEDLE